MTKYSIAKKRRAISGLMQVAMIVGIVVIFAGVLFAFANEIFTVQTTNNSIAMQRVYMYDVDDSTYVSANVKNVGNHDVQNVTLRVLLDTDPATSEIDAFSMVIEPALLEPGMSGAAYAKIIHKDGTPISLESGKEVAAVLEATSSDGSIISEPVAVRVR